MPADRFLNSLLIAVLVAALILFALPDLIAWWGGMRPVMFR